MDTLRSPYVHDHVPWKDNNKDEYFRECLKHNRNLMGLCGQRKYCAVCHEPIYPPSLLYVYALLATFLLPQMVMPPIVWVFLWLKLIPALTVIAFPLWFLIVYALAIKVVPAVICTHCKRSAAHTPFRKIMKCGGLYAGALIIGSICTGVWLYMILP